MSVTNTFITQFESEVKIAYGAAAKLRPAVRTVTATGSKVRFPTLLTEFTHQAKAAGADLTYNNGAHDNVEAVLSDYYVPVLVEKFDQLKTNVDLRGTYVRHIANAMGKIHDVNILTELATWDGLAGTTPVSWSAANDDILDRLIDAAGAMNNSNVPMSDRTFIVKAGYMTKFLQNDKTANGDYNSIKALVNGTLNTFMGFTWLQLPDNYFADADTVGFCVHKDAIGMGLGADINIRVDYIPQKVADQVLGTLSMGSKVIDPKGIVEIVATA